MTSIISGFKANFLKQKHTKIPHIHILLPLIGAIIFSIYFYIYPQRSVENKVQLIIELATSIFPLLIGIVTTIFLISEEKSMNFRWFLNIGTSRTVSFCSFVLYVLFWGVVSSFILWIFTLLGIVLCGVSSSKIAYLFLKLFILFIIGNVFTYIFHIIIYMKFGMGVSLMLSIFKSVFVIFIGNMNQLAIWNLWKYLPHAFSVKLSQIYLWKSFGDSTNINCTTSYITITLYTVILFIFSIIWINNWDGKKIE